MQSHRLISRSFCILAFASLMLIGIPAHASPVTDSYTFDNTSADGDTVTGTFTFDTSNPSVLTDFTLDDGSFMFDSAFALPTPTLPTFDGSELVGSFSMEEDYGPFLLTLNGSFSSPATGDACSAAFFLGEEFVGGDSVSGPITYDLSGGGSAVPLPTGASSGLVALLGLGGLLALRRRRMAIGS